MKETKKRRTEILIETHQLTIIRVNSKKDDLFFCPTCEKKVAVFNPTQAALIFNVSEHLLEQFSRRGQIHFMGENALCGLSLADKFKKEIRFTED